MEINLKSPLGFLKGIGMFLLLVAVSGLVLSGAAAGIDMVLPGRSWGATLKSWFRIG